MRSAKIRTLERKERNGMSKALSKNKFFASACAGASFAALSNLPDAVLASVFVVPVVLVRRIIIENDCII